MGSSGEPCYDAACVNRAYSALPLESDLRIDAADIGDALVHLSQNVNARLAFDVMTLGMPAA